MAKTDMEEMRAQFRGNDVLIALALLTRLPLPYADFSDHERPAARAAWAYPLAGFAVAALAALLGWALMALGIGPAVTAIAMIALMILATGAMHEDGLADCADGFWGGWEATRRLEIMKDSAIGTYGTLALICGVGLKAAALAALLGAGTSPWIVIIPAMMSRAAMVWVMDSLPNARAGGLSATTGQPGQAATRTALALGLLAWLLALDVLALAFAALAAFGLARLARAKIGGQTGDVLGATQFVTEAAILIALSAAA